MSHLVAQKICRLVVGKEASTICTLHGIAIFFIKRDNKKNQILQPMSASRCSVAQNHFQSSLRILFTAFLETKTHLWKFIWAISGCCIGSSGSPLHLFLQLIIQTTYSQLKVAEVSPSFKIGNIQEVGNYRPTSALPIFSQRIRKKE